MTTKYSEEDKSMLRNDALEHLWIHTSNSDDLNNPGGIRIMTSADGIKTTDIDGNTFLDPMAGLEMVNVGYGRKEIAEAIYQQLLDIPATDTFRNQTVPQIRLAKQLAQLMPGSLSKVFFVTSGSEANEAALKIVWQYQELRGKPNKKKIVARRNSYHGSTLGPVTFVGPSSTSLAYSTSVEPLPSWGKQVAPPNPYRCDYCNRELGCSLQCAREIETLIKFERPETVAAVIIDPMSAQHGAPTEEYIKTVRDICKRHDVLLWFDEVISGFGRTGRWFAANHWEIEPDIMTVSKGITSGYIPLGAAVVTEQIAAEFSGGPERALRHGQTYGGHPVACVAGLVNLEIIEREQLVENSRIAGNYLLEKIEGLLNHNIVGDVSGMGLFVIVELVEDSISRQPLLRGHPILRKLMGKLRENGLVGSPYLITPPLTITENEIDDIIDRLETAITETEKETG